MAGPHVRIRVGKSAKRDHAKHDDDRGPAGWSKHREPLIEKTISSLTAGAGSDRWAQRASKHSGAAFALGLGKKSS